MCEIDSYIILWDTVGKTDRRVKTLIGISAGKFDALSHAVDGGTVFEPQCSSHSVRAMDGEGAGVGRRIAVREG